MRYLGEKLKDLSETPEEREERKIEREKWARKARSEAEKRARVVKETAALEIELTELVDRLIIDLPQELEERAKKGQKSADFKLCKIYNHYGIFNSQVHPINYSRAIERLCSFCRYNDLRFSTYYGGEGSDSKGDYTTLYAEISWRMPGKRLCTPSPKRSGWR